MVGSVLEHTSLWFKGHQTLNYATARRIEIVSGCASNLLDHKQIFFYFLLILDTSARHRLNSAYCAINEEMCQSFNPTKSSWLYYLKQRGELIGRWQEDHGIKWKEGKCLGRQSWAPELRRIQSRREMTGYCSTQCDWIAEHSCPKWVLNLPSFGATHLIFKRNSVGTTS